MKMGITGLEVPLSCTLLLLPHTYPQFKSAVWLFITTVIDFYFLLNTLHRKSSIHLMRIKKTEHSEGLRYILKFPNWNLKKFERRPLVHKLMYWYLFIFVAHIVILISYGVRIVKIIFSFMLQGLSFTC